MYNVFLSYDAKDSGLAQDLGYRLQDLGAEVSLHQCADGYPLSRLSRLRNADELVILLTEHSVKSPWVLFEIGAAWGQRKRLTPVVVGLEGQEVIPLQGVQCVEYKNLRNYLADLADRVRQSRNHTPRTKPEKLTEKERTIAASGA